MKKVFNKKILGLGGFILVFALGFLVKSYANKEEAYELRLNLNYDKKIENSLVLPRHRQVAYWKLEDDKMGPWDTMRLAKDCDEMSLGEVSKKLGKEPQYSDKSKLSFNDKEYDKMTDAMYEKNKGAIKEIIKIKNLKAGAYLIKETDQSVKESGVKEKFTTRIEYLGEESAPDGILDLFED